MRLILEFHKDPILRHVAHLDLLRAFQRAFKRAAVPVAYSQGFHPHPRFSMATALSVGLSSCCECLEMDMSQEMSPELVMQKMNEALPYGMRIRRAGWAREDAPKLMAVVGQSLYRVTLPDEISPHTIEEQIATYLNQEQIIIEYTKKNVTKSLDAKPMILTLSARPPMDMEALPGVWARVQFSSEGALKPELLVSSLLTYCGHAIAPHQLTVDRMGLYAGTLTPPVTVFDFVTQEVTR